jgi:3D (Asp-Asp-Asp) domain-containing protein
MLKKMKILVAAAALSGTVSANVQAATVTVQTGDSLWSLADVHKTSVENLETLNHLTSDQIHPGDVLTISAEKQLPVKKDYTLLGNAITANVDVVPVQDWNKVVAALIHPDDFEKFHAENMKNLNKTVSVVAAATKPAVTINQTTIQAKTSAVTPVAKPAQAKPVVTKAKPVAASAPAAVTSAPTANPASPETAVDDHAQTASSQSNDQSNEQTSNSNSDAKVITVKATAYTASCEGCSGITKTGVNIKENPDAKVIAVDPSVIPLGSKVYIEGFGEATAADTGGAIKGHRIDVFIPTEQGARNFGVKQLKVTILN